MNAVSNKIQLRILDFVDLKVIRCMLSRRHWSLQTGLVFTYGNYCGVLEPSRSESSKKVSCISFLHNFHWHFVLHLHTWLANDMDVGPSHLFLDRTNKYCRPARCTAVITATCFRIEVTAQRSQVAACIIKVSVYIFTLRWLLKSW